MDPDQGVNGRKLQRYWIQHGVTSPLSKKMSTDASIHHVDVATKTITLNVAICQIDIKFKQISENKQHISQMLAPFESSPIDFLVFPEMTLSGYVFKDKEDILPFCERAGPGGEYFEFCLSLAKKFNCTVFLGFPEKELSNDESTLKLYNSMYVVSHNGNYVTYRKHFLFEADMVWAEEGDSFMAYDYSLVDRCILLNDTRLTGKSTENTIRIGVGICMDIDNGTNYCSDINLRELTTFHRDIGSDVLIFMCNWFTTTCHSYWLDRLQPMISTSVKFPYFVACNRIGNESGIDFCGMSCVYGLSAEKQPNHALMTSFPQSEEMVKIVALPLNL